MHRIPTKLLYVLTPVLIACVILIDNLMYIVKVDISFIAISLKNLRGFLLILLLLSWFLIMKRRLLLDKLSIAQILGRFTIFMTINFVIGFMLKFTFSSQYNETTPVMYENYEALIHSNTIGLIAIGTLIPIVFSLRELIYYKQKRTTHLYFNLFLLLLIISSIWAYFNDQLLNFEVLYFNFSESGIVNTLFVWMIAIVTLLLSLRNDWITYLPRRQKYLFFGMGIFVYIQIAALWDIYSPHLSAYSFLISNFGNIIYFFLLFYGGLSMLTLLLHLPTAKAVDRKLREVQSLYDFSRLLNSELNYQKLTQLITQLTAKVLESQSTWLEIYDAEKNKLKVISHINLTQQQILHNPFDDMGGINDEIVRTQKPLLINDVHQHPHLRYLPQWKKDARALITAPLFSSRDQLMGIIYATKPHAYGFDIDDVSLLEGFANQTSIALENADLWQSAIVRERLEQELKIAREVQLKLVPQTMPDISGFSIDSYFLTAYEVGGDYYDFIQFADRKPGVVIGDVSGKGTSAAFYMAEFKGVIQTLAQNFDDAKNLICQANRIFYSTIDRQTFVTAVVGKFIPEKNVFQFIRAGHTPILYCSKKLSKTTYLQPPGLGIGLEKGEIFNRVIQLENIHLQKDDFLVLSTDGLLEIRNKNGEEFGEDRLLNLMKNCDGANVEEIKDHILDNVMQFAGNTPLHDDMTFIVIKFGADGVKNDIVVKH